MIKIKKRWDSPGAFMHQPLGKSQTKKGANLTVAELLKKTTLAERSSMVENSPLYDEFDKGFENLSDEQILSSLDLSSGVRDLTDAQAVLEEARSAARTSYERWQSRTQKKNVSEEKKPVTSVETSKTTDDKPKIE